MICDYFNGEGKRVERIYIAMDPAPDAADRLREFLRSQNLELLHDMMAAEANLSGKTTSPDEAALALNALLNEIADGRMPLSKARGIASIGINFHKSVSIAEIMPALETGFGGYAASWACGIFR